MHSKRLFAGNGSGYSMDELELEDEAAPEVEQALSDTMIKKAAALAAAGAKKTAVAKQLKLSGYYVTKIWKTELFKKTAEEIGDNAVFEAKIVTRRELSLLARKAVIAIEKNLDKHSLAAAQVVLRSIGLENPEEKAADAGGFTLVLAGQQPAPKTIEVKREGDE